MGDLRARSARNRHGVCGCARQIVRVDLSGTTRAKTLDLTQGGAPLTEAIAEIRGQFGAGPVLKHFSIGTKRVGFSIRDPENPAQAAAYASR